MKTFIVSVLAILFGFSSILCFATTVEGAETSTVISSDEQRVIDLEKRLEGFTAKLKELRSQEHTLDGDMQRKEKYYERSVEAYKAYATYKDRTPARLKDLKENREMRKKLWTNDKREYAKIIYKIQTLEKTIGKVNKILGKTEEEPN